RAGPPPRTPTPRRSSGQSSLKNPRRDVKHHHDREPHAAHALAQRPVHFVRQIKPRRQEHQRQRRRHHQRRRNPPRPRQHRRRGQKQHHQHHHDAERIRPEQRRDR